MIKVRLDAKTINQIDNNINPNIGNWILDRWLVSNDTFVEQDTPICEVFYTLTERYYTICSPAKGYLKYFIDAEEGKHHTSGDFLRKNEGVIDGLGDDVLNEYGLIYDICYVFENPIFFHIQDVIDNNSGDSVSFDNYLQRADVRYCWKVKDGDYVENGDVLLQIGRIERSYGEPLSDTYFCEEDTIDFEIAAPSNGYVNINNIFGEYGELLRDYDSSAPFLTEGRVLCEILQKPLIKPKWITLCGKKDLFNKELSIYRTEDDIFWKRMSLFSVPFGLIHLAFLYHHYQLSLFIEYCKKSVTIKKTDTIQFAFYNNKTLTLDLQTKSHKLPIENSKFYHVDHFRSLLLGHKSSIESNKGYYFIELPITTSDLELFTDSLVKICRISSKTRLEPIECLPPFTKTDTILLRDYAIAMYEKLRESNLLDQPLQEETKSNENESNEDECYVYIMEDTVNHYFKIGISNKPEYREKTLQSEKPTIELIRYKQYPSRKIAKAIESALHESFSDKHLRGEWFELNELEVNQIIKTLS